jgi:hypothetical protein
VSPPENDGGRALSETRPASAMNPPQGLQSASPILPDTPAVCDPLEVARLLIGQDARIFAARPALDGQGNWDPSGGVGGYVLPKHWERTVPSLNWLDPTVRGFEDKAWRPGWALCMVTGGPYDVVDLDPRNGSDGSREQLDAVLPPVYAEASTPSGGAHLLVATLGVGSRDGFLPGVDLKGGKPDGSSRGFVLLAPTRKISKATGAVASYEWVTVPPAVAPVEDGSGASLAALVRPTPRATPPRRSAPAAAGDVERVMTWTAAAVDGVRRELREAHAWPEGYTDDRGRGWQKLCADAALRLGSLARADWCPLSIEEGERAFLDAAPHAPTYDLGTIWRAQYTRGEVADYPDERVDRALEVRAWADEPGVRVDPALTRDTGAAPAPRRRIDVSNAAVAAEQMCATVGTGPLSRVFLKDGALVDCPLIGEDGYVPSKTGDDGPGQVRRLDVARLRAVVQAAFQPFTQTRDGDQSPALFPKQAAEIVIASADMLPGVRTLHDVVHAPAFRQDGSLLDQPGYDEATQWAYLPQPGLHVPQVASAPTRAEVDAAVALLRSMVADFAFVTEHDEANFHGLLVTPLLRAMLPGPYKLGVVNAPQPGAGKTLLVTVLRLLHGGVFRAEVPHDDAEMAKTITAILDGTTAPVAHLDNATGVLRSPTLAALLTSGVWQMRRLGSNELVTASNNRLWIITGNNVALGGDLVRRSVTVTIDPGCPNPHLRDGFAIRDLESWVLERRGEILHAALTLIRGWVVAGRPIRGQRGSDSYARWIEAVDGILAFGGIPGTFDHVSTVQQEVGADDDEWRDLLAAAHRAFGSATWTARDLLGRVDLHGIDPTKPIPADALPADLADKALRSSEASVARSLGMWAKHRAGRWAGHYVVRQVGKNRDGVALWSVETYNPRDLAGTAGTTGTNSGSTRNENQISRAYGKSEQPESVPAVPAVPAPWDPFAQDVVGDVA